MSRSLADQNAKGVRTFPVDDVKPAAAPIWTEPLRVQLEKRLRRRVLLLPDAEQPVTNSLYGSMESKSSPAQRDALQRVVNRCHPLVDTVATAFAEHRPLRLTPDCIWLAIEQGFAHHVAENAEALRPRLVRHEGNRGLETKIFKLDMEDFESAISDFSEQIRENTDHVLHETLVCNFSTTTRAIRTASEVVLMDCYSSYFTYLMKFICGIPKVTVLGTVEDWERVRARVEILDGFGLTWWVKRLRPILDEFVHTAEGNADRAFWQAIYKPKKAYGDHTVTGWLADLFPYLNDAPERRRNHILQYEREDWAVPIVHGVDTAFGLGDLGADKGVGQKSFPSGLASVPVNLKFPSGTSEGLDLVAGFFGVEQSADDLAVSPVIGWAVVEPAPSKPILI
jgi:hypothetical protein